jgi:DNA-binding IclR family transcriptional regulator
MNQKPIQTYSAPALEKGLDIIELLSEQDVGLTQSEIARALGRSVGEIFRMLMVLQDRGYVSQDPLSDRYVLTTFIFEIAHRIPIVGRLTAAATPLVPAWRRAPPRSSLSMGTPVYSCTMRGPLT